MPTLSLVGMFVQGRAVEGRQPVRIVGEMARHPIEDDRESGAMTGVDQFEKIVRRAEPAGRSVKSRRLVAPRPVERMLRDGQKFDVREAEIGDVGRKLLRQLPVSKPAIAALRRAPPRAEMDLI